MAKRLTDLIIATLTLILTLPVALLTALAIRIRLGSPVLFKQRRTGRRGRLFDFYKFRTMTDERDARGELLPDDRRLTRFGQLLRKSSLDELPQLINVLRGDLSLVGPRPLLPEYLELYSPDQARRLEVKPGITGWAQIHGRNALGWEERFELDVWYVDHRSYWLDWKILLRTLPQVLRSEGISRDDHVTMPRFTGAKEEK